MAEDANDNEQSEENDRKKRRSIVDDFNDALAERDKIRDGDGKHTPQNEEEDGPMGLVVPSSTQGHAGPRLNVVFSPP